MTFADHFSANAAGYATFRPSYPEALFDRLAALVPRRELAWDVGTGSGQAAVQLAKRFARVHATDASREQLARATPHPRVTYAVALEDASGLADGSVDLVTVAQALHWFDPAKFEREVARVLAPHGLLAAWCYGRTRVAAPVDQEFDRFYDEEVKGFWPLERNHVDTLYREIPFPYDELPAPALTMSAPMTLEQLLGYVGTWSAVASARKVGRDLVRELRERLAPRWGDASVVREVAWPVGMRLGRPRRAV